MRDATVINMGVRELSAIAADGASDCTTAEDGMVPQVSPIESDGTEFFDAHEAMPWSPERPSTHHSPATKAARRMQLALWPEMEQRVEELSLVDEGRGGGGGGGRGGVGINTAASSAPVSTDTAVEPKVCVSTSTQTHEHGTTDR